MDDTTIDMVEKAVTQIKSSFKKKDFKRALELCRNMIEFSLDRNSEMGVLIGEILEIVVVQYFALFDKYIAKNKDKALTISIISPIIYELSNSILLNDDELIFSSLKHLRWHATKNQYEFGETHELRDPENFPY